MPIEITVPRLGWSMDEGVFVGWLKKPGDVVKAGEPLFTLEGEKAAQDIEALDGGILSLGPDAPAPGATVAVGAVLGWLITENEPVSPPPAGRPESGGTPKASPDPASTTPQPAKPASRETPPERPGLATPRARRRAAQLNVNLAALQGTGRAGRIREADVLAAAPSKAAPGISSMRRAIARRTSESAATVPHFHLRAEVDASALIRLREELVPSIQASTGVRLTVTDLLLRAQALALRDFPNVNAIWKDDTVIRLPASDVGLVVSLPEGLLIPIVRSPDQGGLAGTAKQRGALVDAARSGRLGNEALLGGATTLSNLGGGRVDEFTAVIPVPHSSILAIGRAAPRPWVVDGRIEARTTLKLCLSVDHRVLDGAPAAEFLSRIIERLEAPESLVG